MKWLSSIQELLSIMLVRGDISVIARVDSKAFRYELKLTNGQCKTKAAKGVRIKKAFFRRPINNVFCHIETH